MSTKLRSNMFPARRGSRDDTHTSFVISWILATFRSYRSFLFFIALCIILCSLGVLQYASFNHSKALVIFNSSFMLQKPTTTMIIPQPGVNQRTIKDLYRNREPSNVQPTEKKAIAFYPITSKTDVKDLSEARFKHIKDSNMKTQYPLTLNTPYFLENPTFCSSVSHLKVLVIVHTAPSHFSRRDSIRRLWTNATYLQGLNGELRVLFLLGRVKDIKMQTKLENEFKDHKDLLQGDFIDAYRNLSHKGVMGYKWIAESCRNAEFVLKVDDDVVVNTYKLYREFLPRFANKTKQIMCNHIFPGTMLIIRNKKSKWYVDEKYFKGKKYYPRYCSGFMVLFTNDVIPAIYRSASMTPFFWVDDVYLYGLVPSGVPGIKYNGLRKKRYELTGQKAVSCYKNVTRACDFIVTGANKPELADQIWSFMIKQSAKPTMEHIKKLTNN